MKLGDRVTFTRTLSRRGVDVLDRERGRRRFRREWSSEEYPGQPEPEPREGIVVGVRTLADGSVDYSYEEPAVFVADRRFRAYLIAFSVHRKPVLVLPEHVRPVEPEPLILSNERSDRR